MNMNIFRKVKELKEGVAKEFPRLTEKELKQIVQKLANKWHYKSSKERKKVKLTEIEGWVYSFLISRKYNPSTVYRWLLLKETPLSLREQLRNKEISQREASKVKREVKFIFNVTEKDIVRDVIDSIDKYIIR